MTVSVAELCLCSTVVFGILSSPSRQPAGYCGFGCADAGSCSLLSGNRSRAVVVGQAVVVASAGSSSVVTAGAEVAGTFEGRWARRLPVAAVLDKRHTFYLNERER